MSDHHAPPSHVTDEQLVTMAICCPSGYGACPYKFGGVCEIAEQYESETARRIVEALRRRHRLIAS